MRTDPFALKKYPKWNPRRLAFTLRARIIEKEARFNFTRYAIPEKSLSQLPSLSEADWNDTAVTPVQMSHLLAALKETERLGGAVVEVGGYRGVTARCLAAATNQKYFVVDPFRGWGGAEEDYEIFLNRTSGIGNLTHLRNTSGEAARAWSGGPISFIFIDACHDYVNTSFDIEAWSGFLIKGGILALHDTDLRCFAGTRKAAHEVGESMALFAHPDNLTILSK